MTKNSRNFRNSIISIFSLISYILFFLILYPSIGPSAGSFSVIPILVTGWYMGMWPAIIMGILMFPINTVLFTISGNPGLDVIIKEKGLPGHIAGLIMGVVVGHLHDLKEHLNEELMRRNEIEKELEEKNKELEKFAKYATDRELEMVKLKEKISELEKSI